MFESFHFLRPFFTKPKRNPLEDKEAEVRAQMARYFNDYEFWFGKLLNEVLHAIETYSEHPEVQRPCANVEMPLLARLLGDLRVCQQAACTGYPLQAMSVASSAREVAFGLIYIGDSDERAREWVEHEIDSRTYPPSHRSAIEAAKGVLGFTDADVEREYRVYVELCWGKHGNPKLQRTYGRLDMANFAEVQQLPYFSELTIRYGRHALLHACLAVIYAAGAFVELYLRGLKDTEHLTVIESQLTNIGVRDQLLATKAAAAT